ncbi:uncharacterized protein MELLADRAFT_64372 [Melampsora larici-populina 98AG31]|uniref:F-box domain-containing protein n=1 Tax=Melampsora larici-populina (strain 98AG31 / pathotype 3-4-7) TaxID=747676 RepID=F4RR73_MELLP|nr:uncharacterized protein MELLADRAFT_64372 [Melampsora larici-populina 98AG31]EGG05166.1 hypothetical protein MELLADRAFT_64372 [Melampsora larici-populina 98AG31]
MARADFPEEILDNIVNMVHYQPCHHENYCIKTRKEGLVVQNSLKGVPYEVYLNHSGPPILNTFQNLAVVNRRFHRLCCPKLWQHIQFPSTLPAPITLWTNNILLRHGHLVKSLEVQLEDDQLVGDIHKILSKRSSYDNTGVIPKLQHGVGSYRPKYGIGLYNIEKLFKACPSLVSISVIVPESSHVHEEWISHITASLHVPFWRVPQLQDLRLTHCPNDSITSEYVVNILQRLPSLVSLELCGFEFRQRPAMEESFEWSLGQQKNLRKLRMEHLTYVDGTWTLFSSWPPQLENLQVIGCDRLSPRVLHGLLSGSAPSLTKLRLILHHFKDEPHVTVRFNLPALKELSILHRGDLDLLMSFENCKSVEAFHYQCHADDEEWHSMKQYLSRCTWPKLSVLDFRSSIFTANWKKPAKMDVNEIWNSFKIKLLIDNETDDEIDDEAV